MPSRVPLEQIALDWTQVRPDLDLQPMLTFIALNRTGRLVEPAIEAGYAASGQNAASFDLLLTLYRSSPADGFTPSELATHMVVTPASVTNRIDRLFERGLVRREPSIVDRRSLKIQLSPEGRKLVEQYLPLHLENERRLLSVLTKEEQAALEGILKKLLAQLETDDTE